MMKFIMMGCLGVLLFLSGQASLWLMSGFMVFMMLLIMINNFSFLTEYNYASEMLGGDIISYSLVILSFWVSIMMFYSSVSSVNNNGFYFYLFIYLLMLILLITFYTVNLLTFYFFFEASLIPTLLIIMGWGYQPERLQAGLYFLFYTLFASLPLLAVLMYYHKEWGLLDLGLLCSMSVIGVMFGVFFSLAFLVKLPMFFVHLWLPKAHVEAPVAGSMILAGVLLKLGGYGLVRVFPLSLFSIINYTGILYGVSIVGMMFVGFMCCRLNDLKALVAYSSVAHMALVICGCFSFSASGLSGSLMMMISHGVSSSGLFCMVNMYYERSGSRSFYLNKGNLLIFPIFCLMFFLLCASNMAAPPTINLLSEIFLMISIMKYDIIMLVIFPLGSFMGAVFTIFMFSYSQHGASYLGGYSMMFPSYRELHILIMHIIPLNFIILKSEMFMSLY
nr:NADH dehydrogenase subunit 4 [Cyphoderus sp.]